MRALFDKSCRILTAFPGTVALAARKAAMLSVVPVHTAQSFEKPARISMFFNKVFKLNRLKIFKVHATA